MSNSKVNNVLFIDDEPDYASEIICSLKRREAEFNSLYAKNEEDALIAQRKHKPLVGVLDLCLDTSIGAESGLLLMGKLLQKDPNIRIIVLTGQGADTFGIKAIEAGAISFLSKPVNIDHLLALIRDAINYSLLKRAHEKSLTLIKNPFRDLGIISRNKKMNDILEKAMFAASNSQPILILGETGTGKGVLARAIHKKSKREKRPFLRFQPSFGTHDLISSELFGHEKGSFTGANSTRKGLIEEANRGTLFIDEVGELPQKTQIMLLEVLQENRFKKLGSNREQFSDVRFISATNKSIKKALEEKTLREDFLHRICHIEINLIPLRERKEDILQLSNLFLNNVISREDLSVHSFSTQAIKKLENHFWPGNIRELQAVVENSVYRAAYNNKQIVNINDIEIREENKTSPQNIYNSSFRDQVKDFELKLIKKALKDTNNNQSKAAKLLQIDRSSLRRILKRDPSS